MVGSLVHAGRDRVEGVIGGRLQPAAHREGLVVLKVAGRGELGRLAVERDGRPAGRASLPGDLLGQRQIGLFAQEIRPGLRALALGEGQRDQRRVGGQHRPNGLGRGGREERLEGRLGTSPAVRDGAFGDRQLPLELGQPGAILLFGDGQDRRRVLDVAVPRSLCGVVEEGREGIKVLGRDRVELVVVANGTADGQPHPDRGGRLGAVAGVEHDVFLVDDAPLVGRHVAAVEAAADPGLEHRVGRGVGGEVHEIAGELELRESVEGQVVVEGLNNPLPVGPHLPVVVEVDPVGVGIAGVVEPMTAAVLTPLRRREQDVEIPLIGVGPGVGQEGLDGGRVGGQAGDVEGGPAGERAAVGLRGRLEPRGLEPGEDEAVDRVSDPRLVLDRRRLGLRGWDERPVGLVFGPFLDPADEQLLLGGRERLLGLGRRHHLLGVVGEDPVEHHARVGVARHKGAALDGLVTLVEPEVGLAAGTVGPVAGEAVLHQDRADIAVVGEFVGRRGRAGGQDGGGGQDGAGGQERGRQRHAGAETEHRNTSWAFRHSPPGWQGRAGHDVQGCRRCAPPPRTS